jgi:hypothetical protein
MGKGPDYPDWLKQMHENGKREREPENLGIISKDKTGETQKVLGVCKECGFTESPGVSLAGIAAYYAQLKTGLWPSKIITPALFERYAKKHTGVPALQARNWLQSVGMLEDLLFRGLNEGRIDQQIFNSFVNDIGDVEVESIFLRLCTEYKVCLEWPLGGPAGGESANSSSNN